MDEGVEAELTPVRLVRDGKVIAGRDGWLFLSGDRNLVLSQHSGELTLDDEQLKRWAALLARRRDLLAERGIAYVFMVAPDTHSIYPDKLPEGVEHTENRPVIQLRNQLAAERSPVQLIYPLEELREARKQIDVCSKTDSHWNDFGTFVVYSRLVDEIEDLVPARRVREEDLVFVRTREVGDLGFKVDGRKRELILEAAITDRRAKLVRDNRVEGSGSVVSTVRGGTPGSCVLMADSYGWGLFKYVAESFGRLTYVYTSTFDLEFLEREQPDVVVNLVAERFIVRVPDDEGGRSVAAHEARKLALGRKRLKADHLDLPGVPSTGDLPSADVIDRMRASLVADGRLREATILMALAYGGLRQGEISRLMWRDLRPDGLRVRGRRIPLAPPLATALEQWRQSHEESPKPNQIVLPGGRGAWRNGEWSDLMAAVYDPLAKRHGMDEFRPQMLRHFFVAGLIDDGAGAEEVARLLGVSVDYVRAVYGPWFPGSSPTPTTPMPPGSRRV
jgi:alginate O-acetyltransferase complex protein AlgJ